MATISGNKASLYRGTIAVCGLVLFLAEMSNREAIGGMPVPERWFAQLVFIGCG